MVKEGGDLVGQRVSLHQYPRLAQAAHEADWEFLAHAYNQRPTHLL